MPVQIRAESLEEFKRIQNDVKKLPDVISGTIESAERREDARIEYTLLHPPETGYYLPCEPTTIRVYEGNLIVEYFTSVFIHRASQKDTHYMLHFV